MSLPRLKILIIDDDPEDRETCRRFLSHDPSQDYAFVQQDSVEGALETCRREKPDCILLDYHLPDGNGVEFLQSLGEIGGTRVFPVVMLTGVGSELGAVDAMKAGAQDYLSKTRINPESLHRTVTNAIYKARTDRLLESQRAELEQAYREAQEANARKDQFIAALSHELRTPLTPILTAVSAVDVAAASAEELRDTFALIRRNVELEARLIDDLLDLTRISKGKVQINAQPVDVHEILRHALAGCREGVAAKRLAFTASLEAGVPTASADAARLQQVFSNLLTNAIKFTPNHGRVSVATRNPSPGRLEIEVSDSGIGLEPGLVGKIFDAFEQGSPVIPRQYGGLGLGLAICKALVEAHEGGGIRARSAGNGQGASFVISLATTSARVESGPQAATSRALVLDGARPAGAASTILLVEDHADSARLLRRILEHRGYRVLAAGTVAEAVELFQREAVQVIISDIGLPDGSGVELMRRLRALAPVPGIALSGYGTEQDLQRSLEAGFDAHLTKPVDWPRLEAAVRRLLDPPGSPPAASAGASTSLSGN